MLESAQLTFIFESDAAGVFGGLSRAEQRRIERDFMKQVTDVVADATLRAWLTPAQEILSVEIGGVRVGLDPGDESMTRANLTNFFSSVLAGAATESSSLRLAVDVSGRIQPLCKIKVDGNHIDEAHCPVALVTIDPLTGQQSQTEPWVLRSTTDAGVAVTTQVKLALQFVAPDPT